MALLTELRFTERLALYNHEKPYEMGYTDANSDTPFTNIVHEDVKVSIQDARPLKKLLSLEKEGFVIADMQSKLLYEDFFDRDQVKRVYAEELRHTLTKLLGARGVYFHETVIRSRNPEDPAVAGPSKYEQPISNAHIDYSLDQIYGILRELGIKIPSDVRVGAVNIWKPLKGPLRDYPLAICDASSVDPANDLLKMDTVFPEGVIEGYSVQYNPNQRWFYVSQQTTSELLIFNSGDSESLAPVPHCAFRDPTCPIDEEPRESIEFRAFVFY